MGTNSTRRPCVLTIAGSDSGAGAGLQADSRTIQALGGFACTAVTAVTAQNTRGVQSWRPIAPALIAAQIAAVMTDLPVVAVKTGLLPGAAAVRAIARALQRWPSVPLVIDPVIGSTSGTRFLDAAGVRALEQRLLPRATLVTPNWPEAGILAGRTLRNFADAEQVAKELAMRFGCAVLLKGGHGPTTDRTVRDCLVTSNGGVQWFGASRVKTRNTHGTGCVLSAAIATRLGFGDEVSVAVASARRFLRDALQKNRGADWGGAGPAFPG